MRIFSSSLLARHPLGIPLRSHFAVVGVVCGYGCLCMQAGGWLCSPLLIAALSHGSSYTFLYDVPLLSTGYHLDAALIIASLRRRFLRRDAILAGRGSHGTSSTSCLLAQAGTISIRLGREFSLPVHSCSICRMLRAAGV